MIKTGVYADLAKRLLSILDVGFTSLGHDRLMSLNQVVSLAMLNAEQWVEMFVVCDDEIRTDASSLNSKVQEHH